MTPLDRAVHDITTVLESLQIEYAIVGGIANAIGASRGATIAVDVTASVDEERLPATVPPWPSASGPRSKICRLRAADGVLPLDTDDGVRIDVIFALLPFELDAIRRARDVPLAGRTVHVVSVEALILMKIISERPRDVADAEALVGAGRATSIATISSRESANWRRHWSDRTS